MNDLNYVLVTGKLTRNPELKMLTADTPMCQFTIAINRYYKKKGAEKYSSDASYFFVESWGDLADNSAQYLTKGRKVRVVGHLKQARWNDHTQGGRPMERTYIVAEHIEFGEQMKSGNPAHLVPETDEVKSGLDKAVASSPEINEKDQAVAEEPDEDDNK